VPMIQMRATSKVLAIASILSLAFATSSQSDDKKSQGDERRAVVAMCRAYARLEEKQDYLRVYNLLSPRFKRKLEMEENVKNATDYNQLRLSSEAQWSNFKILGIDRQSNDGYKLLVEGRVNESGIVDIVKRTYYIVEDQGKWKIDRWEN
jgi:hypothetical protein